jgi:two-component system nitrogen regulation response regulator GlnG
VWRWVSRQAISYHDVMPDENAVRPPAADQEDAANLPVIVMSAQNTMTAIRAWNVVRLRVSAKPSDLKELITIVGRALAEPKCRVASAADDPNSIRSPGRPLPASGFIKVARLSRPLTRYLRRIRHRQFARRTTTAAPQRPVRRRNRRRSARPDRTELFGQRGAFTGANTARRAGSNRPGRHAVSR